MRNKGTWILLLVLVLLIGGAGILYKTLSSSFAPDQLTVEATPVPAESDTPEQSEATAEQADPTGDAAQIAPDFTAYDADGNAVQLSDYFGKPLVLNFWASW